MADDSTQQLQSIVERMRAGGRRLAGVFHLAGVLRDAALVNQSRETLEEVLRPKVLGAWHLHRLLQPAMGGEQAVHLVCREDATDALLAELATHALDVVIADGPAPAGVRVKVYSHLLGESETSFFAAGALAAKLRRRFPGSLNDAPLLLPTAQTALRRALEGWFEARPERPEGVTSDDWLRWEQQKHQRLLAAAAEPPPPPKEKTAA